MARAADQTLDRLENLLAERPEDVTQCCELAARVGILRQKELVRLVRSIAEVRARLSAEQRKRLEDTKF